MNGTGTGSDEQAAPVIFVQQTGACQYVQIAYRVGNKPRYFQQFVLYRQHLP